MDEIRPKISIIVPIYNAEKYLQRCIDSVLLQTFKDFELLLIDDGSTDKSGMICEEYAKKDKRVHVYHKTNGGVSSARNMGLDNSKGLFIGFVDADDWLELDYLQKLISYFELNIDLVECSYIYEGTNVLNFKTEFDVLDSNQYLMKLFLNRRFYEGFLWVKLFKRDLIGNLRFETKLAYNEDRVFIANYLLNCKKIKAIQDCLYHYYNKGCNAMSKLGKEINEKTLSELESYRLLLRNENFERNIKNIIAIYASNVLLDFYMLLDKDNIKNKGYLDEYYSFYSQFSRLSFKMRLYQYNKKLGYLYYKIQRLKSQSKIYIILKIKQLLNL